MKHDPLGASPGASPQAECAICHCQTGGAGFCYEHAPYMVYPQADGSFLVDRNGRKHVSFEEPPAPGASPGASPLGFNELQETNQRRCEAAFHRVDAWLPWEWSNAMAGECGEACNITKKMNRIWPANQFKQNWNKPEDQRMAELEQRLADELADVVIYADLLATRIGRNLGDCVRAKFNEKSDEIGSAIKLQAGASPGASPAPQREENKDVTRVERGATMPGTGSTAKTTHRDM